MVKDEELAEFLKDIQCSANRLAPSLSVIVGMLEMLLSNLEEDSPYIPEIRRMERNLREILSLIQEIAREKSTARQGEKVGHMGARI